VPAADELSPSTRKLARALSSAILGLSEEEQGIPPNRNPHVLTIGRRVAAQMSRTPTHSELMGAAAILHHKLGLSTTQLNLARSVLHDFLPHHGAVARTRGVPLSAQLASLGSNRRRGESSQRRAPRPRGAGRPAVRGSSRRSSARSGDSSNDDDGEPEPPGKPAGRLCACGCGRSLDGRRRHALLCGPRCQKRIERQKQAAASVAANDRTSDQRWQRTLALAADIAKVEAAIADGAVATATGECLLAILLRRRLRMLGTRPCGCDHASPALDPDGDSVCALCGHLLNRVASRINGFDAIQALMASNGTFVHKRARTFEWRGLRGAAS
jgi:hypothetical protein